MKTGYRLLLVLVVLTGIVLAGAQCATVAPQVVEKQVTVVVEKEVLVTPTPGTEAQEEAAAAPEAVPAAGEPVYGGTIRATFVADIPSMDPPPSWDAESWAAHMLLYNGLLRFKHGSAEVEPELATDMPTISEDGTVFTFQLRDGLQFSSGRPLTAADVKYSLDRLLDDETQGWATAYYMGIKGAREAFDGTAEGVEGVRVIDDLTLEIELNEPLAPDWIYALLATSWAYVVDREAVEEFGEEFRNNPRGAGPYVLVEYIPGQIAVFERNPNYWRNPEEPYADRIEIELGVDTTVGALKLETGEIDLVSDPLPPAALQPFLSNPDWQPFIAEAIDTGAYFIALDASQGPTADLRVRQAIAHAVDKERLIQVVGASAVPAKSLLSPSTIYHDPSIPEYEYDPERAKALLAEAGVEEGTLLEFWSANFYPWAEMAQAIQQDLEAVGFTTDLHLVGRAAWYEANGQHNPIVFNQWPLELPDPSYIFDGGFSRAAFYPDSCCNWSWYSTEEMEAQLKAALTEPDRDTRIGMYQEIDRIVVYDEALWIPLFHLRIQQVHSPRLGGYVIPQVLNPSTPQFFRYWVTDGQ